MAVFLHRGSSGAHLIDALASLLCEQPVGDPCVQELIVVTDPVVALTLSRRLAECLGVANGTDGVCAGARIVSPSSLVACFTATDHRDPWRRDHLAAAILEVLETSSAALWYEPMARKMFWAPTSPSGAHARWAVARRAAELFAEYALERPDMLEEWQRLVPADGHGGVLDDDLQWQPRLWAMLVQKLDRPAPTARFQALIEQARLGLAPVPRRISILGSNRLCMVDRRFVRALAPHHDVHLFSPIAASVVWDACETTGEPGKVLPRRRDTSLLQVRHPLTAALGRNLCEFRRQADELGVTLLPDPPEADAGHQPTLLSELQAAIRADSRSLARGGRGALDDTLQIHACASGYDQVRVLCDAIYSLLANDHALSPQDVVIMCPDVSAYESLLISAFRQHPLAARWHPGPRFVSDPDPPANPLVTLLGTLVKVVEQGLGAHEVLLSFPPLLRSFWMFSETDLQTLDDWFRAAADVHDDAVTPEPMALAPGLQERWRLFSDWLLPSLAALNMADTASAWLDGLATAIDRLALSAGDGVLSAHQLRQAQRLIRLVARHVPVGQILSAAELRTLLAEDSEIVLAAPPPHGITVQALTPMRLLPYRVIAIMGLDQGSFPRPPAADGDNVLFRDPLTGERDTRSDDRQMLLDAIMSAGQSLILTYTGLDAHTGGNVPPAAPLAAVIEAVQAMSPGHADPVVRHLVPHEVLAASTSSRRLQTHQADDVVAFLKNPARAYVHARIPEPPAGGAPPYAEADPARQVIDTPIDGRRLVGVVDSTPGLTDETLADTEDPAQWLAEWFWLLCLTVGCTDPVTPGRPAMPAPLSQADALAHLRVLLDLYERRTAAPAFPVRTTFSYAATWHRSEAPDREAAAVAAARRAWQGHDDAGGENAEVYHAVVFGESSEIEVWASTPDGTFDSGGFRDTALSIWLPLLQSRQEAT